MWPVCILCRYAKTPVVRSPASNYFSFTLENKKENIPVLSRNGFETEPRGSAFSLSLSV